MTDKELDAMEVEYSADHGYGGEWDDNVLLLVAEVRRLKGLLRRIPQPEMRAGYICSGCGCMLNWFSGTGEHETGCPRLPL